VAFLSCSSQAFLPLRPTCRPVWISSPRTAWAQPITPDGFPIKPEQFPPRPLQPVTLSGLVTPLNFPTGLLILGFSFKGLLGRRCLNTAPAADAKWEKREERDLIDFFLIFTSSCFRDGGLPVIKCEPAWCL
jgi:hypothetical protein